MRPKVVGGRSNDWFEHECALLSHPSKGIEFHVTRGGPGRLSCSLVGAERGEIDCGAAQRPGLAHPPRGCCLPPFWARRPDVHEGLPIRARLGRPGVAHRGSALPLGRPPYPPGVRRARPPCGPRWRSGTRRRTTSAVVRAGPVPGSIVDPAARPRNTRGEGDPLRRKRPAPSPSGRGRPGRGHAETGVDSSPAGSPPRAHDLAVPRAGHRADGCIQDAARSSRLLAPQWPTPTPGAMPASLRRRREVGLGFHRRRITRPELSKMPRRCVAEEPSRACDCLAPGGDCR